MVRCGGRASDLAVIHGQWWGVTGNRAGMCPTPIARIVMEMLDSSKVHLNSIVIEMWQMALLAGHRWAPCSP